MPAPDPALAVAGGRQADLSASPWIARDALRWTGWNAIAIAALAVAWFLASDKGDPADQLAPVALAIAAAVVSFAANVSLLLRGRSLIGGRTNLLLGAAPETAADSVGTSRRTTEDLVRVSGRDLIHRSSCSMARGRDGIEDVTHIGAHRTCPICRPAEPNGA